MQATRRIPRARRRESVGDVLLEGVPGAEPRGSERGDQHERDDDETEQRRPPTGQTSEERQPLAPRDEPIGGGRGCRGGGPGAGRGARGAGGGGGPGGRPPRAPPASFFSPGARPGGLAGWPGPRGPPPRAPRGA